MEGGGDGGRSVMAKSVVDDKVQSEIIGAKVVRAEMVVMSVVWLVVGGAGGGTGRLPTNAADGGGGDGGRELAMVEETIGEPEVAVVMWVELTCGIIIIIW